jgi:hypothetical protein
MKTLVLGKTVVLSTAGPEKDTVDRYGRWLRYVDVDGTDAGLAEINVGLAIARYDSRDGYGWHPREDGYVDADQATAPRACGAGPTPPHLLPPRLRPSRRPGRRPVHPWTTALAGPRRPPAPSRQADIRRGATSSTTSTAMLITTVSSASRASGAPALPAAEDDASAAPAGRCPRSWLLIR